MINSFRDLIVFQRSYKLSLELHKVSLTFPKIEQFELASQIRRASKSIPVNIAEGYGKRTSAAEFKRFLTIAQGSCDELKVHLEYCKDLEYISKELYDKYYSESEEISKMLTSLTKNWKTY